MSGRIIVHSLAEASAAVAAAASLGVSVTLQSAPGAGTYAGPLWFAALVAEAARPFPAVAVTSVIDCADEAGTALAALRAGFRRVRYSGRPEIRARLAEIAAAMDAVIEDEEAVATLDLLGVGDPEAASRAFLDRAASAA